MRGRVRSLGIGQWIVSCPVHGVIGHLGDWQHAQNYAHTHMQFFHGERTGDLWH